MCYIDPSRKVVVSRIPNLTLQNQNHTLKEDRIQEPTIGNNTGPGNPITTGEIIIIKQIDHRKAEVGIEDIKIAITATTIQEERTNEDTNERKHTAAYQKQPFINSHP